VLHREDKQKALTILKTPRSKLAFKNNARFKIEYFDIYINFR